MQRVIIFDFDGVLADTRELMLRNAEQACAELGHPCQATAADLEALDAMNFPELGRRLGLPEAQVEEFTRRTVELFNLAQDPPEIFPGMAEALARLSALGRIAVLTGNGARVVRKFLAHHGLADVVEHVLTQEDPGTRAEKIARLTRELGVADSRVYMIGDSVSDIRAARQAGVFSVAVTWGHQSKAKLSSLGPDLLVEAPHELINIFQ
jgi:HAD superfamily hydrolase (TIGR01549 family)